MIDSIPLIRHAASDLDGESTRLTQFGLKLSPGGAHISRTMMLAELAALLAAVPHGSSTADYAAAIVHANVLCKATRATRDKTRRHLRELYALDERTPIFGALRFLHAKDAASLPLLSIQVAWARDPLLRATTSAVLEVPAGDRVETASLAEAVEAAFPNSYSELNRHKIARNAASSWTQSGHLAGRTEKIRQRVQPTAGATALALFLSHVTGHRGPAAFASPWCRLLDLDADRARNMARGAHRAGLLTLRMIAEVVELSFPELSKFEARTA